MKKTVFLVLFVLMALCAGCQTTPLSLAPPETYSLEREGDAYWRVNHDSEYYQYFNKIQATYDLLLKDAKDPAEQRRLYIERDRKIAEKRLEHMADSRLVKQVIGATKRVDGTNPTGHIFRLRDVTRVPRQDFTPADPANYAYKEITPLLGAAGSDAMTAIIQFDRQLKKRGVSLIVVPVPNAAQLHAHKLHKDIHVEDVIWHPWAHMIAKLLQYDVEVIDLLDLYKTYSGDNTTINYIDHHWGQAGLDIVGWELGQRLQRFRFEEKYYLDPASIERVPITVKTPALIPHWDKLSISYIASRMPYSPTYRRVSITYKNRKIEPARSFEDSPVLLMGDSFIPHAADTSSGIYAHLAYYTRIIPAAISKDAGAAEPPNWYRQYVAGRGKEPKVVIWEIYGSTFQGVTDQDAWHVVTMPEPERTASEPARRIDPQPVALRNGFTVTQDRKLEWVAGEVARVSVIPEVKKFDYPDALYAFHVRVTDGLSSDLTKDKTIIVYGRFLENFKIIKDSILKKGNALHFYLEKWLPATHNTKKIGTMQVVDDLEDYDSDVYFDHFHAVRADAQLTKLKKTYLEKNAADKDGNPLEALTFKLEKTNLVASMRLRLRRDTVERAPFAIETSIDGKNWFSLYTCRSAGGADDEQVIAFDSVHPAAYVRLTGPAVKKEIVFDDNLKKPGDFSGIDIYGY
ncbi:MAG: hypothetical protein JXD23_02085 [Spirochaetales bacterium]|nr:hypothetical protein [Spirochaetales bacterium]